RKGVVSTTLNLEVLTTSNIHSEVTASPDRLIANDEDDAIVTVTLISKNGHPIKSERVSLQSNRGPAFDQIEPSYATTDSSGKAIFKVKSQIAGSATLFAFDEDDQVLVIPVATVEFLPGPLHHFSFSKVEPSVVAGVATEIIIAARDQYNNLCTNHSGSVDLFLSDARASIPSSSAPFVEGLAAFQNVVFKSAGIQTARSSDGHLELGPKNITVVPANAHHLAFQLQPSGMGTANETLFQSPQIGVFDPFDNRVENRPIAISLSATSDENCSSPIAGALTANQNPLISTDGVSAFQDIRILKTEVKRIKASTSTSGISSACSAPLTIIAGPASPADSSIQGFGPVIADGSSHLEVKILLKDSSGNPIPGMTPTFDATDSDGANLYGLCSQTDQTGNSTCTLASTKAESKTLRLSTPIEKTGNTVIFKNGPASSYVVSGFPASITAGTSGSLTIRVFDAHSNPVLDYQGIVRLSSSDLKAVLPGDFGFSPSDFGQKTISGIALKTTGARTITATDTLIPGVSGNQSGIMVASAAYSSAHSEWVAGKASLTSGETTTMILSLRDAYGNENPQTEPLLSEVAFFSSLIGGTGTFGEITKTGSGTYQTEFTAVKSGSITLSAKIAGIAVDKTLSLSIDPGAATRLSLSRVPVSSTAGQSFNFEVSALDSNGNIVNDYSGIPVVTSNDSNAILPAAQGLPSGTGNRSITLKSAGTRTLSVSDGNLASESSSVTVNPDTYSLTRSAIALSSTSASSGNTITVRLTPKDLFGNPNPSNLPALSKITFTSSHDTGTGTFGPLVVQSDGSYTAEFTALKNGTVTIGATISGDPVSTTASLLINPGNASSLVLSAVPDSTVAGTEFSVNITAYDSNSNVATGFADTVTLSSNDSSAGLPAAASLTGGTGSFSLRLKTAGLRNITATAGSLNISSGAILVSPAAYSIANSGISAAQASMVSGSGIPVILTMRDAFGNSNPSGLPAASSISYSSSIVGGTGSFEETTDLGSGVYQAVFTGERSGAVQLSASIGGALVPNTASVTITPGAASQLFISSLPGTITSGASASFTVTAKDSNSNTVPSYAGSIQFSSTDTSATLPSSSNLTNGTKSFSATFRTAGSQTISITDGSLSASASITVDASGATQFTLSGVPSSVTAGDSFTFTVTARDSAGNLATGFGGEVSISSSDPNAGLPAAATLSSGSGGFSVTLNSTGAQTITASGGNLLVTSTTITVAPGSAPAESKPSWFVSFQGRKPSCSGAMISDGVNSAVLAPADCVRDTAPSDLRIQFSEKIISSASSIVVHQSHDPESLVYDIALIKPEKWNGTPLDIHSDFISPRDGAELTIYGIDEESSFKSWPAKLEPKSFSLKSFDPLYMFTIKAQTTVAHGGFLAEPSKTSASGYLVSGFSFYQTNQTHTLINLSSQPIQSWIKQTLEGSSGGQGSGTVTTLAGNGTSGTEDGSASSPFQARLFGPQGLVETSNGDLLIADTENHSIRYFDRVKNAITTIAGYSGVSDETDGDGGTARFGSPYGMAMDPDTGTFYVSDRGGHTIRSLTISSEQVNVTTVAGIAFTPGFDDGDTSTATFSSPGPLAWYKGGLLILDTGNVALRYLIKGNVSTILDSSSLSKPSAIAIGPNNEIFIADLGDHTIKVLDDQGMVSIYAGIAGRAGFDDAKTDSATFNMPSGIAVDSSGNVYVSEIGNKVIRKIDSSLNVTTLAGDGTLGSADGPLLSASFNHPGNLILLSDGSLALTQARTSVIRQLSFGTK
ncbi:MAG: Ig-like domain-containing protein, partial [Bdellovibrionales bacterium]|nr:Ig-like domain-containing protein [Bdellovibrionales bacterium]